MGRQWNQIIESLGPLTGGTMSINANLGDIEALLTTLQADVADGITVSSGTVTANGGDFVGEQSDALAPQKIVQIGYYDDNNSEFLKITQNSRLPVGNEPIEACIKTDGANIGTSAFAIAFDSGGTAKIPSGGNPLPIAGTVTANPTYATSGGTGPTTFTSTSYGTIAASNSNRKGLTVFNEGAGNLHITIGTATTSTSSYTIRISSGDYYELPYNYTGLIGGIFATAGTARVTEIV
jgi:hypothetical protein